MTCTELERLYAAGASATDLAAHRSACASCEALGAELEKMSALVSSLRPPAASPVLRQSLLSIPRKTVSCEGAAGLISVSLESDLPPADQGRLGFHLSRCEGCSEAAAVLLGMRDLTRPEPAPWLAGRVAAVRGKRRERRGWRFLLSPRAAIGLAYAAAVIVMLAGFNPADLARKAGVGRLEESARESVQMASGSLADRLGAFEESAMRKLAAFRGRAAGYGRAVLSTAIALVMKNESKNPPSRPRGGEDKGSLQKIETEVLTWRA